MSENFLKVHPPIELYQVDIQELAKMVARIVEFEGPIHFEEMVRRLRSFWGLNRAVEKNREAVSQATVYAAQNKLIRENGDFLWPPQEIQVKVRYRDGDPPPRLELICDEEIMAAVELVLKTQYATLPDDLAVQASRLLGIKVTTEKTANRIEKIINKLVNLNKLRIMPNGMINFSGS